MLGGKKLGGVLPVARYQGNALERAVLGVGLNVCQSRHDFPADLREQLTTLLHHRPELSWDVVEVAASYLRALEVEWETLEGEGGMQRLCAECEPYLEGLGDGRHPVLVAPGQAPRLLPAILGLSAEGALRLEGGQLLASLGRDQRLRFADEIG